MNTAIKTLLLLAATAFLLTSTATPTEANPYALGIKCAAAKLKAAGKDCMCRHKALSKAVKKASAADFGKCQSKAAAGFSKAETKGQGWCRTESDGGAVDARIDGFCTNVSASLAGQGELSKGERKCAAKKIKAAGKLCMCLHKARSKATAKDTAPDYTKCRTKFASAFAKAEAKGACTTTGDATAVEALVDGGFVEVEADLLDLDTEYFSARGSYGVGNLSLDLVDVTRGTQASGSLPELPSRTLPTDVWYPADALDHFDQQSGAPLVDENKAYPLIIRSHGYGGFHEDSTDLTQHLASHGYIVVAATYPLSNFNTPFDAKTLLDIDEQARDVSFLIDTMLGWNNDPENIFYGRIDTSRIGATGH